MVAVKMEVITHTVTNRKSRTALMLNPDVIDLGSKELAEVGEGGVPRMTVCDHLGSPRFVWDGVSAPIQQKFLSFGESLADPLTSSKIAKGYTNHEQTDPSGLIYMQARFYLPMYGKFASPDPARDQQFERTQSWNITSYMRNNPITGLDPTGMIAIAIDQDLPEPKEEHMKVRETELASPEDSAQTGSSPQTGQPQTTKKDCGGRGPDIVTLSAAAVIGGTVGIDRHWNIYYGLNLNGGVGGDSLFGGSLLGGWVQTKHGGTPSSAEVQDVYSGWGINATGGFIAGGGINGSLSKGGGVSVEGGLVVPGAGGGVGRNWVIQGSTVKSTLVGLGIRMLETMLNTMLNTPVVPTPGRPCE